MFPFDPSGATGSPSPAAEQLTAEQLRQQVIGYADDVTSLAGGQWTDFGGNSWDPATHTFTPDDCTTKAAPSNARQIGVDIQSGPHPDPVALAEQVAAHWKQLGYTVSGVGKQGTQSNGYYTEIRADIPDGSLLGFTVSNEITALQLWSACSTDPSLRTPAGG